MLQVVRRRALAVGVAGLFGLASVHCIFPLGKSCTLLACLETITVDLEYAEEGSYTLDVEVDGLRSTCTVDTKSESARCEGSARVRASRPSPRGSKRNLGTLQIENGRANAVKIRAQRDGVLLHDKSVPVTWTTSPGPNGPDCDEEGCRSGRATYPGA